MNKHFTVIRIRLSIKVRVSLMHYKRRNAYYATADTFHLHSICSLILLHLKLAKHLDT